MFTETDNVPVLVPDVGDIPSHAPLVIAAVQFSVLPPEFEMLTVWLGGLAPPSWPTNVRVSELSAMFGTGGAAVTFRVTGTVTDESPVLGATTRMVAVYI
jgi:hypothetical protein